ncbi:hypothetical protein DRP53_00565 [candidate division WOR-3 bacterium]|uniref:Uncharacterized protein n=1 Tax=candidate division WOR-3 bacterium TaxID=2052148 RepID=A0A660SNS4_UNCW3|nr:MAG: hypothetical protein DRP53_00565 [candidate division WOR-3 bacterium]
MARKSWREKLREKKDLPKVVRIKGKLRERWGEGTVAIPAPVEVDEIMKKVPKGKLITISEIREIIARKHHATIGCPITCGIFTWIAAHAAEEETKAGKKRITPYWRTLKSGGYLNEKYPGGISYQRRMLELEGHRIVKKGKRYQVVDYEQKLIRGSCFRS